MAELTSSLRNLKKRTEPRQNLLSGNLGITLGGQELVDVPGRSGFVYVRLLNNTSELIQAYNGIVSPIYNLPILVKRNKDRYEIYGRDTLRYQNWGTTPYLPIHGNQHSFDKTNGGGGDLVWVHQEQFYPLAVTPSGTYESPNVIVAPYLYNWYGAWHYYAGGGAPDCALAHPTGSSSTQVLLLCLDGDAGTLHYITGSVEAPHLITGSAGLFPHLPSYDPDTDIPLAAICITTGTTTIGWEEIYDVRQFFGREQTGGGTGSVSNHNSLTGLDGGTPGEYYHFTQLQYNDLTDGGETNLHYHTQTGSISGYVPNRVVISDGSGVVTTNNGFFYDGNLLILGHDSVPATYPGAFHVVAQDIGAVTDLWTYGDHAADSSYYVGHRARGTIDAPESIQDNDTMLFIRGRGFDGAWVGSRVGVTFVADESWVTGSANGTRIEFNATPVGSITMGIVATLYGDGVLNIPAGATYNIDGTPHTHVGLLPGIHNVLNSTYHGDVLTGNIARGDLLIGNSTPKIGQLAIGATPNSVLKSDGTDPSWSTYLLTGTSGGTTSFAVTNTKTLTLTATDNFNLTVPATGTAALLATQNVFTVQQMIDGTADQIQLRVQANATQTTNLQTWETSVGAVLASVSGTGVLTIPASPIIGGFTIAFPATGTVDLLGTAQTISATKTFTAAQKIYAASALLIGYDSTSANAIQTYGKVALVQLTGDGTTNNGPGLALIQLNIGGATPSQSAAELILAATRGAAAGTRAIVANNDILGTVSFYGDDGVNLRSRGVVIQSVIDTTIEAVAAGVIPARLAILTAEQTPITFHTNAGAMTAGMGAYTANERMRIRYDGNVGIGGVGSTTDRLRIEDTQVNGAAAAGTNTLQVYKTVTLSSASDANYHVAIRGNTFVDVRNTYTLTSLRACVMTTNIFGTHAGTVTEVIQQSNALQIYTSAAGTVTSVYGINTEITILGANTTGITTYRAFNISTIPALNGTTIGTAYGLYVGDIVGATTNYAILTNAGRIVFNDGGNSDSDFRVEGDTEANMLFLDASADTIAFGGTGAAGATVSKGGHLTLPDINFSPSTPATLSGDVNDYDLGTNTWIRLSGGVADRIVTGIVARTDGHYMIITNVGATNKVSFSNESGSSAAANRIITAVAGTVELHPYESLFLLYDSASSRWREIIHA
jgi:hypothetical protein